MIEDHLWKLNIENCVKEFSDKDFQERIWIKSEGPEFSSFDEAMCGLYDDSIVEEFIKHFSGRIQPFILKKLEHFLQELDDFSNSIDTKNDLNVISHPRWNTIVEMAIEVYRLLSSSEIQK